MIVLAIGVSLFLCLSGVMAAVDAAILSVTHPEIEELVHQRRFGANRLRDAKRRLAHSVVVIVVITNTINVLGPILIGHHAFGLFDRDGILLIMAGLTIGTIVFSEILPKAIGNRYAPTIARWSAHPLMVVQAVLYPLVALFAWMSKRLTPGKRKIGTEPQIRSLVRIGHAAGHIETDEENLIQRVFLLNDRTAADIMTPLSEVHALSIRSNIEQAAAEASRSEYSRYPLFGANLDEVLGVILSRDLLKSFVEPNSGHDLRSLAKPALIVEADTRSDDLLILFRDRQLHLAVVQRYGQTIGVVTLEDVLEELVGEIFDEKDIAVG